MTSAAVLSSAVPFNEQKTRLGNAGCGMGLGNARCGMGLGSARCGMGLSYGTAVKNTVRHMVSNLENVITNLQGIVGDLHILVQQIDVVTNKMDNSYGTQWSNGSNVIHKKKTTKKNHLHKKETKNNNSVFNWQLMAEKSGEQCLSPDIDWSYLSLTNNAKEVKAKQTHSPKVTSHPCRIRRIREPNPYLSSCGASIECDTDTEIESGVDRDSKIRACCDFVFNSLEFDTYSSDTNYESLDKPIPIVPAHVFCEEIVGSNTEGAYCGMYEAAMESKLENLSECDDDDLSFDQSDIEEEEPSIKSGDFQADYNRCVNPWTSFNLVHLDSTHDSDDLVSDCASDILNENYIDSSSLNSGFDNIVVSLPHHICF